MVKQFMCGQKSDCGRLVRSESEDEVIEYSVRHVRDVRDQAVDEEYSRENWTEEA